MQCDKTSSILNSCFCGCRGEESGVGWVRGVGVGVAGSWQCPDGGASDTASASLLHDSVPARQHAAICRIHPQLTAIHISTPDPPPPSSPSGCCSKYWQHNRLIRRFTALIKHAQKCCRGSLFGGSSPHTASPRLKANVACKTVWSSVCTHPPALSEADSPWHPTDSWNGWGPPDFWGPWKERDALRAPATKVRNGFSRRTLGDARLEITPTIHNILVCSLCQLRGERQQQHDYKGKWQRARSAGAPTPCESGEPFRSYTEPLKCSRGTEIIYTLMLWTWTE